MAVSGRPEREKQKETGRESRASWTGAAPLNKTGMSHTTISEISSLVWFPTRIPNSEQQAGPVRGGEKLDEAGDEMSGRLSPFAATCHSSQATAELLPVVCEPGMTCWLELGTMLAGGTRECASPSVRDPSRFPSGKRQ